MPALDSEFSEHDLQRLRKNRNVGSLHFKSQMESTSDCCRQMLSESVLSSEAFPLLVLTELQTQGRGQLDRTWWAEKGALTFTWARQRETSQSGILSLAVAKLIAESIEAMAPALTVNIKWPNDVFVSGKKVAGILIESIVVHGRHFELIGIGINVNNSVATAPTELSAIMTSLIDQLRQSIELTSLLETILEKLVESLEITQTEQIIESCAQRSVCQPGSPVTVSTPQGERVGTFVGFGPDGQLQLRVDGTTELITSGSITSAH